MTQIDQRKYEHFYHLIERHKALIEGLCIRRASDDSHRCAELIQECYIQIWRHETQISTDMSPAREALWVYWLCRSAFSRWRFLQRTHTWLPLHNNMSDAGNDSPLPDSIDALVSVLTPHERGAFKLMAEGYTPQEMARELGITHRSAVQLRYRIVAKLRRHHRRDSRDDPPEASPPNPTAGDDTRQQPPATSEDST